MSKSLVTQRFRTNTISQFQLRNHAALAAVQLHAGKAENWFSREFSIAMNCALGWPGGEVFTECELGHADISLWEKSKPMNKPRAFFEVKVLHSTKERPAHDGILRKAWTQLQTPPGSPFRTCTERFLMLVLVHEQAGNKKVQSRAFFDDCRKRLDTDFKVSEVFTLLPTTYVDFGASRWSTASQLVWAQPR